MNTKPAPQFDTDFPIPDASADCVTSSFGVSRVLWTKEDVQKKVAQNKIVVFAKGKLDAPRCGLSDEMVSAIEACGKPYEVIDVSEERSILPALKAFVGSRYLPLVFIDGELVSSWENQAAMLKTGELKAQIEKAYE